MSKRNARGQFVSTNTRIQDIKQRMLKQKANEASFKSLGHAGASIRQTASRMVRPRQNPSAPGSPPHSATKRLKRGILYWVDKHRKSVIIGPDFQQVGPSMLAHEFGERFRGQSFPKRPLMGPALNKQKSRLPKFWKAAVR